MEFLRRKTKEEKQRRELRFLLTAVQTGRSLTREQIEKLYQYLNYTLTREDLRVLGDKRQIGRTRKWETVKSKVVVEIRGILGLRV